MRKSTLRSAAPTNIGSTMISTGNENILDPANTPDDLSSKIDLVLKAMVHIQDDLTDVKRQTEQIGKINRQIADNSTDIKLLQNENKSLRVANTHLTKRLNAMESYSRLNNLILKNVPEDAGPTKQPSLMS